MSRQLQQIDLNQIDRNIADADDPLAVAGEQAHILVVDYSKRWRRKVLNVLVPLTLAAIALVVFVVVSKMPGASTKSDSTSTAPARATEDVTPGVTESAPIHLEAGQPKPKSNDGTQFTWALYATSNGDSAPLSEHDVQIIIDPPGAVEIVFENSTLGEVGELTIRLTRKQFDKETTITAKVGQLPEQMVTITLSATIQLSITLDEQKKTDIQNAQLRLGSELSLEFNVQNSGTAFANGVIFTMPIPDNTELVRPNDGTDLAPQCKQNVPEKIECSISQIGPRASGAARFTLRAVKPGEISLDSACVNATGVSEVCATVPFAIQVVAPTFHTIGLSSSRPFIAAGQPTEITAKLVDDQGDSYAASVDVSVSVSPSDLVTIANFPTTIEGGEATFQVTSNMLEKDKLPMTVTLTVTAGANFTDTLPLPLAIPGLVQEDLDNKLPLLRSSPQGDFRAINILPNQTPLYLIRKESASYWEVQIFAWVPTIVNDADHNSWKSITENGCYLFVSGNETQPPNLKAALCESYGSLLEGWIDLNRKTVDSPNTSDYVQVWARGWVNAIYVVPLFP